MRIDELLEQMVARGASDLHITVGTPPQIRIDEVLVPMEYDPLTPETVRDLVYSMLTEERIRRFEDELELDFSFGLEDLGRFRCNVFKQRNCVACVIRMIPLRIRSLEELRLPRVVSTFADLPKGLVLVTGATGSGKSTTLAALIDLINSTRRCHIITVEDPIEYVHQHKKSIVNQREVGTDTKSFASALKYVLREDPDVILIGEMRDLETIRAALTSAETGHLVFATLHTSDAVQTVNRIIDVFPSDEQEQVRTQLSFVLQAIIAQQLVPMADGSGRVVATEIMVATPAIRALIRESKAHQIYSIIQTSRGAGMQTMNQSLYSLYKRRLITAEEALARTLDRADLARLIESGDETVEASAPAGGGKE